MKKRNFLQRMQSVFTRVILSSAILAAVLPQTSSGAEDSEKGLSVNIALGCHGASAQYPDLQWIGQALMFDSISGEQPIRDFYAGEIGLSVSGRFGRKLRIEPSLNVFGGMGGGTKPTMFDTSYRNPNYDPGFSPPATSDTSYRPPTNARSTLYRRDYGREEYFALNLALDLGIRIGISINLGNWQIVPMAGLKGNMLQTGASEYFCGSYYWLILPLGVTLSHPAGDRWRIGMELFADPVVWGMANWAFNIIIAGDEGEFVNLGTPVGFSGCLKFTRSGRRGAVELSPYVTYFHHERSNVAGSNIRLGWWSIHEGEKWFEPAGSTLRIGVKAGWLFAFGKKQHVETEEEDPEEDEDE